MQVCYGTVKLVLLTSKEIIEHAAFCKVRFLTKMSSNQNRSRQKEICCYHRNVDVKKSPLSRSTLVLPGDAEDGASIEVNFA